MQASRVFERFTPEARQVLVTAQAEARELRHDFIGTEDLLLGMAGTSAGELLERLGAPMSELREAVRSLVGASDDPAKDKPPFTPRSKKVLELSLREALARNDNAIRPEHLLLGILREGEGVAATVLAEAGITYEAVSGLVGPVGPNRPRFWRRGRGPDLPRMTPGVESALAGARKWASGEPVTTYHLLRALLEEGVAGRILRSLDVTRDAIDEKYAEFGTAGTSDDASVPITVEGEDFRVTPEQAEQIRRYLAGGDPPLPANP